MHQHGQALTRQQQRQQRREHRQFACAVVAGDHDDGLRLSASSGTRIGVTVRHFVQPLVRGIQKTRHLLRRLALDAHGQAERANFQIRHRAVEHLPKQVRRLFTRERPRALFAAPDFLDVFANCHMPYFPPGDMPGGYLLMREPV